MTGVQPHNHGPKAQGNGAGDVVDVHAHFLPDIYRAALDDLGVSRLDGGMPVPTWSAALAIETMDRHGIATAILSVSSPGLNLFAQDREQAMARAINESAAQLVAENGGRFGAFATLPVGDPDAAIAEIDHALDVLGLDGFILETNHRGAYPGDPAFAPMMAALNARRALVLLHPTSPACAACQNGGLVGGLPAPVIEFPFDTTRALVDLLYSGTLQRFPGIRFILAHAGGTVPFLASRIAGFSMMPGPWSRPGLDPAAIMAQLARLHYDTALSATPQQLAVLRSIAPVDNILFGSDWPFSPEPMLGGSLGALRTMDMFDDAARAAMLGGNARRLLRRQP